MRGRSVGAMLAVPVMVLIMLSETRTFGQVSAVNLLEQRVTLHIKQGTFLMR